MVIFDVALGEEWRRLEISDIAALNFTDFHTKLNELYNDQIESQERFLIFQVNENWQTQEITNDEELKDLIYITKTQKTQQIFLAIEILSSPSLNERYSLSRKNSDILQGSNYEQKESGNFSPIEIVRPRNYTMPTLARYSSVPTSLKQVQDIKSSLMGLQQAIELVQPNRSLIKEGDLKAVIGMGEVDIHLFLFNDLLICAVPIRNDSFMVRYEIFLENAIIRDHILENNNGCSFPFDILIRGSKEYIALKTFSLQIKETWVSLLQKLISNCEKDNHKLRKMNSAEKITPIATLPISLSPESKSLASRIWDKNFLVRKKSAQSSMSPNLEAYFSQLGIVDSEKERIKQEKEKKQREKKEEKEKQKRETEIRKKLEKESKARSKARGKDGGALKYNGMKAIANETIPLLGANKGSECYILDCAEDKKTYSVYFDGKIDSVPEASVQLVYFLPHLISNHLQEKCKLLDLITENDMIIVSGLCSATPRATIETVAKSLLNIFKLKGNPIELIRLNIQTHIGEINDQTTLFRTNSVVTQLIGYFCKIYGGEDHLVKTLRPLILNFLANFGSFELDPTRIPDGENIQENLQTLISLTQNLIDGILASVNKTPPVVRIICNILSEEVRKKFPEAANVIIGGFVFLRYFIPAIISPESFNIIEKEKVTPNIARCLLLISKCLQSLANGVQEFKKQEFMKPLSVVIEHNTSNVMNFFSKVSECNQNDFNSIPMNQGVWDLLSGEDFQTIHTYISQNLVKIGEYLDKLRIEKNLKYDPFIKLLDNVNRLGPPKNA